MDIIWSVCGSSSIQGSSLRYHFTDIPISVIEARWGEGTPVLVSHHVTDGCRPWDLSKP